MRVIQEGVFHGRTESDVLNDAGYEPGTPEAAMLLALPARVMTDARRPPMRPDESPGANHGAHANPGASPPPKPNTCEGASVPGGPAAAPGGTYGSDLRDSMSTMSKVLEAMNARLHAMEKNTHEYVDGLRRDAAATNLGVQEQLRTIGNHLPTNHATPPGRSGLSPSVGRQMPVQTRSAGDATPTPGSAGTRPPFGRAGNFRNDQSTPGAARFQLNDANRARNPPRSDRGPGFSLQFQNFEPVRWNEIDLEQREQIAKHCGIPDEPTYEDKGRRAPCAWCNGNHWLVHCPGGAWANTDACREKVGSAAAEATRLKYDARRAAMQQRQLIVASAAGSETDALLAMADGAEYVPVSRLAAVMGTDMERICALCACDEEDDVERLIDGAHASMADSYLYNASAQARLR